MRKPRQAKCMKPPKYKGFMLRPMYEGGGKPIKETGVDGVMVFGLRSMDNTYELLLEAKSVQEAKEFVRQRRKFSDKRDPRYQPVLNFNNLDIGEVWLKISQWA